MQTIIYQGREVRATLVNFISGEGISSSNAKDFGGDEALFRDEEGFYYLRQTLTWLDFGGENERRASGRTRVHRISVSAAILWATVRLGSVTLDLRSDAEKLLTRSSMSTPAGSALPTRSATTALPDEVTVLLTLPTVLYGQILAMGAYDERADFSETVVSSMEGEVKAWLEAGSECREYSSEYERELKAGQHPAVYPPTPAFELDAVANAMLREVCEEGDACRHPGEDPRDLVNAAVTFFLSDDTKDQCEGFDLTCGEEALERARATRLGKEVQ